MNKTITRKKDIPVWEICLWWGIRVFLAVAFFLAPTTPKKLMVTAAFIMTFAVSVLNKLNGNFSSHLQTCICLTAALGSGVGFGLDVFQTFPEYDVPLSLFGGLSRALIKKHLIDDRGRRRVIFYKIYLKVGLKELGKRLGNEGVVYRLLSLVLVRGLRGRGVDDYNKVVLYILEGYLLLVLGILVLPLDELVYCIGERGLDRFFR